MRTVKVSPLSLAVLCASCFLLGVVTEKQRTLQRTLDGDKNLFAQVGSGGKGLNESEGRNNTTGQLNKISFTELLNQSGSDKYHRHHYERYYERWLEQFRSKKNLTILEIGANQGHSLNLWASYFKEPKLIMGLAYGQAAAGVESKVSNSQAKIQIYRGDQSKTATMDYLKSVGPWDVIIDDGSHFPQHMIFTLFSLWNSVAPGGIYVIEDLETNYWPTGASIYGYRLNGTGIGAGPEYSAVAKLEQIQQVLVRHQIGIPYLSVMPGDGDICSVEWGMNLVMLSKCEDEKSPSHYRKPPMQRSNVDQKRMRQWLEEAWQSNPSLKQ